MRKFQTISAAGLVLALSVGCSNEVDRRSQGQGAASVEAEDREKVEAQPSAPVGEAPSFNLDEDMIAEYLLEAEINNSESGVFGLTASAQDSVGVRGFKLDLSEDKIKQIHKHAAMRLIAIADEDKNGSLSLQEFLSKRISRDGANDAERQKIVARRTEVFAKYAGADNQLNFEEALKLARETFARIDGPNFKSLFTDRLPKRLIEFRNQLFAKYDADKDGKLSGEEVKAMRTDRAQAVIEKHKALIAKICEQNPELKDKAICK